MTDQYLNKQAIINRMRRLAADYYGISQADLIDPVISLFLESLGEEIYKIAGDIDDMEKRILEKLSSMLVSDINTIVSPAHAILHANALENQLTITAETSFHHKRTLEGVKHKLSFYPVCNTRIYSGDVRYFIYNGLFYSVDREQNKTLLTRSGEKESFTEQSFWVGLELDDQISSLENLSFYIDFAGVYKKEQYIKQLPYTVWKIGNTTMTMYSGLFSADEKQGNNTFEFFTAFDASQRINQSVKILYDPNYLTVKGDYDISDKREAFPTELENAFSDTFCSGFEKPLVWIEITCPLNYTPDIIDSIRFSINAIPVVCKELVTQTAEINKNIPLIPLHTGNNESFLSIHSLTDSNGKEYYSIPVNDSSRYDTYSLRNGGCERYNVRDARECLIETTNSVESEASALFKNKKELKTELKQIQTDLNLVVKDLKRTVRNEKNRFEIKNYVLLNPQKEEEIYFVKYWVTNCLAGNGIKAGTILTQDNKSQINPVSIHLLSSSKGGKYAPQRTEKLDSFRKSLTKHSLLVTNDDIRKFCQTEFADLICDISINNGFMESPDAKIGFIRTRDVFLKPHKELKNQFKKGDEEYFRQLLVKNSPVTFNYRVFIK